MFNELQGENLAQYHKYARDMVITTHAGLYLYNCSMPIHVQMAAWNIHVSPFNKYTHVNLRC